MRRAGPGTRIVRRDDGSPWCLHLQADACCEHERGITPLLEALSMGPYNGSHIHRPISLQIRKSRSTRSYPNPYGPTTRAKETIVFLASRKCRLETTADRLFNVARYDRDTEITAAWDQSGFKIAAWTPDAHDCLRAFERAAFRGDLMILPGRCPRDGYNPFRSSGINILITSHIPKDFLSVVEKDFAQRSELIAPELIA